MLHPVPLHPIVTVANVCALPFKFESFDLLTSSNLIFMLPEPAQALHGMKRFLRPGGKFAMLNPSEYLNEQVELAFANEKGLDGVARDTLLNWARRAVENHHWTKDETCDLYRRAGMKYMGSASKVGQGFGRFSWGTV